MGLGEGRRYRRTLLSSFNRKPNSPGTEPATSPADPAPPGQKPAALGGRSANHDPTPTDLARDRSCPAHALGDSDIHAPAGPRRPCSASTQATKWFTAVASCRMPAPHAGTLSDPVGGVKCFLRDSATAGRGPMSPSRQSPYGPVAYVPGRPSPRVAVPRRWALTPACPPGTTSIDYPVV